MARFCKKNIDALVLCMLIFESLINERGAFLEVLPFRVDDSDKVRSCMSIIAPLPYTTVHYTSPLPL